MKEQFRYLIREFHELQTPAVHKRDFVLPKTNKILTLIGARRSGKTYYFYWHIHNLLQEVAKEQILYINFEDDRIFGLELKDLNDLLEAYYELYPENKDKKLYLFLDEIQNIQHWEQYIRRIYDKENIQLFITGSNAKLLSKEIATSLRGRTLAYPIYPLSFKEYLAFNGVKTDKHTRYSKQRYKIKNLLQQYITTGGYPEVVLDKNKIAHDILNNYYDMILYRDIVERFGVRNTTLLKSLSKYLLTNIANPFSINAYYTTIKKEQPASKETIFEFTSHLEEANLVFFIPLFSYSIRKQQMNPKKVYCIDPGLRNTVAFKFSKDEGRLVENIIFLELKRQGKEIYYWKNKGEVDFVVKGEKLQAINICYTDNIPEREINSLLEFKKEHNAQLTILTKDTKKKEKGINYIPVWEWLLE